MSKRNQTIRNKRKIKVAKYENDFINTDEAKKLISKDISRELKLTIVSIFIVTIIMIASAFAIFFCFMEKSSAMTFSI